MARGNQVISELRAAVMSRDAEIEKLTARILELETLADTQAALIAKNGIERASPERLSPLRSILERYSASVEEERAG